MKAGEYSSVPHYFMCENCGFVFLDRARLVTPAEEKERYLKHTNSLDDAGYTRMLNEFIDICVAPFVIKGARVLDYGSGPEPVLAGLLERSGYTVDTYDPFFASDKKFESEKYDAVTAVEVIEHMKNPLDEIKIIAKVLKPGGILAGRTMFLPHEAEDFAKWWYRSDKTHISFYSRRTLAYIAGASAMELMLAKNPCFFVMSKNSSYSGNG